MFLQFPVDDIEGLDNLQRQAMADNERRKLQVAQILADLDSLNVVEYDVAIALVTANQREYQKTQATATAVASLSREDSSASAASVASENEGQADVWAPPPHSAGQRLLTAQLKADSDLERAKTLVRLQDMKRKIQEREIGSLSKARANVAAVQERYSRV